MRKGLLFLVLNLLILSLCFAAKPWFFTTPDVNALHADPATARLSYGNGPQQFGELRLPEGKAPFPVAIVIHGGCWVSTYANYQNTSALADALRDRGFATWNIEYRAEDNGGGYPGTYQDVAQAADFLRTIAKKYSLDLNHVIVIGHSAGGHLALWLAARHRISHHSPLYNANPLQLQGVISLGGVTDLKAFKEKSAQTCGSDVIAKLLSGPENEDKSYLDTSPAALLPLGTRQILIYGSRDKAVPYSFGEAYQKLARSKGETVKVIKVRYGAHHEYIVPNSVAWPSLIKSALSLMGLTSAD